MWSLLGHVQNRKLHKSKYLVVNPKKVWNKFFLAERVFMSPYSSHAKFKFEDLTSIQSAQAVVTFSWPRNFLIAQHVLAPSPVTQYVSHTCRWHFNIINMSLAILWVLEYDGFLQRLACEKRFIVVITVNIWLTWSCQYWFPNYSFQNGWQVSVSLKEQLVIDMSSTDTCTLLKLGASLLWWLIFVYTREDRTPIKK